jgi:L-amino acid N-acyltransferase YncA
MVEINVLMDTIELIRSLGAEGEMSENLKIKKFKEIDLNDPFFDSLKSQYKEFEEWFSKKSEENAYVLEDKKGRLQGFVYLKIEADAIDDVNPPLPPARRLKVGTLKINSHGTKMGERVVKKIFDHAISEVVDEVYVTVFDTHASLISLLMRYGFEKKSEKTTSNGTENVLVRSLIDGFADVVRSYPIIKKVGTKKYLLAIYPDYHTRLFPDSILKTESEDIVKDISHTNTIHKVYISKLSLTRLKRGDVVVIYRTTDRPGKARFRSVATSICVVEEVKSRKHFKSADEFVDFALPHCVFTEDELRAKYASGERLYAAKMTYNAALAKRPIRGQLLDDVGISEQPRWDLRQLSDKQFERIIELGKLNENIIVD